MLSVPHRAIDNKFISSIEGYRGDRDLLINLLRNKNNIFFFCILGNIWKLGRLLSHEWWSIIDKEGKTKERYIFLFKARLLICKVRRISDDRSVFVLKNIIKLPEVEIKDFPDTPKFELNSKSGSQISIDLPLIFIAHKDDIKTKWIKEIHQHVTDQLALQEHIADDLRIDPNQIQPDTEPDLKLPQKIAAFVPNSSIKASDFAVNYICKKENVEESTSLIQAEQISSTKSVHFEEKQVKLQRSTAIESSQEEVKKTVETQKIEEAPKPIIKKEPELVSKEKTPPAKPEIIEIKKEEQKPIEEIQKVEVIHEIKAVQPQTKVLIQETSKLEAKSVEQSRKLEESHIEEVKKVEKKKKSSEEKLKVTFNLNETTTEKVQEPETTKPKETGEESKKKSDNKENHPPETTQKNINKISPIQQQQPQQQSNQGEEPSENDNRPPDRRSIQLPDFFDPPKKIAYETSIEISLHKERLPSPPPPPRIHTKLLVNTASLELRTQEFLLGKYDYDPIDYSLHSAQQKLKSIKQTVHKSSDTSDHAEDTIYKAHTGDFSHIITPIKEYKEPLYEVIRVVENPEECTDSYQQENLSESEKIIEDKMSEYSSRYSARSSRSSRKEGKFFYKFLNHLFLLYFCVSTTDEVNTVFFGLNC